MRWSDVAVPIRMQRVALIAPSATLRDVLARVADAGVMQIDHDSGRQAPSARISASPPDLGELERSGRHDLLAGEAELRSRATAALR